LARSASRQNCRSALAARRRIGHSLSVGSEVELPVVRERHTVVRAFLAILIGAVLLGACTASDHASSRAAPKSIAATTSITVSGRLLTVPMSFDRGLIQLDPNPGATPAVSAAQALAAAGGTPASNESPTLFLGRTTFNRYGNHPSTFSRLVWLVVYNRYRLATGCRGGSRSCPPPNAVGTSAVAVDAETGVVQAGWQWSGE
jgi:hypothetical protein